MMVDPMLQRLLVVCGYLLVVLLSLVEAVATEAPVRSTHQGQVGVYRVQLTEVLVPLAGQRVALTLTSRAPGDQLQLLTAMLAPASPQLGPGQTTCHRCHWLPGAYPASGVYLMLVRRLLLGWWFLQVVVQGNRGTARGVIPIGADLKLMMGLFTTRMGNILPVLLVSITNAGHVKALQFLSSRLWVSSPFASRNLFTHHGWSGEWGC